MKPYEILNKVIDMLQVGLDIKVYSTFSPRKVDCPIKQEFLTAEIFFGTDMKTILTLKTYMPRFKGAKNCRELTEQVRAKLNGENIDGFNELISYSVSYDEYLTAYVQESRVKFELLDDQKIFVPIYFGEEKIMANGETKFKMSRNISVYYSPIEEIYCKDLGRTLKKIEGKAVVNSDQFIRLVSLMESGEVKELCIESQKFNAVLSLLSGRPNGKIEFEFLEVTR